MPSRLGVTEGGDFLSVVALSPFLSCKLSIYDAKLAFGFKKSQEKEFSGLNNFEKL